MNKIRNKHTATIHQSGIQLHTCNICSAGPFLKIGKHIQVKHSLTIENYCQKLSNEELLKFNNIEKNLHSQRSFTKKSTKGVVCKTCHSYLRDRIQGCGKCLNLQNRLTHTCKICNKSGLNLFKKHLTSSHPYLSIYEYIDKYDCLDEYQKTELSLLSLRQKNSPFSVHSKNYSPNFVGSFTSSKTKKIADWQPTNNLLDWTIKFGEKMGLQKYQAWREKIESRHTKQITSLANFQFNGNQQAAVQYDSQKRAENFNLSPTRTKFYINKGFSLSEARKLICEYQHTHILINNPMSKYYWMARGENETNAKSIADLHCDTRSIQSIMRRHGASKNEAIVKQQQINEKNRQTLIKQNKTTHTANLTKWEQYKERVNFYTKLSWKHFFYSIDNKPSISKRNKDWHLDHKFSKIHGFIYSIPPEIIGSPANLSIISARENCKKQSNSSIILEDLTNNYKKATEWNTLLKTLK